MESSNLHAGRPDALSSGTENLIEGIFETLESLTSGLAAHAD